MGKSFAYFRNGPEHVRNILNMISSLLQDGRREECFTSAAAEPVSTRMFTSYVMQVYAGRYIAIRRALVHAGVNGARSHLRVPRNCLVTFKCIYTS